MKKYIVAVAAFVALLMGTTPAFAGAELSVDAFSRHVGEGRLVRPAFLFNLL